MSPSNPNITIQIIHENSSYLQEINDLADQNVQTLSFQGHSFYQNYAKKPGIIVALDDRDLVGYLIWSLNSRNRYARVWQLCTKPEYRGKKIAIMLNNKLIELTNGKVRGIQLECKTNYGIDPMWRKLGYAPIHEKDAKTPGDTLKVWSIEFVHPAYPSIFSPIAVADTLLLKSAIDADTLYNLLRDSTIKNPKNLSIDGLRVHLGLCITDEIFNEIDQNFDNSDKKKLRQIVRSQLSSEKCDLAFFQSTLDQMKTSLSQSSLSLDETSLRHLARCVASKIPYFITYKQSILNLSNFFYINFGVRAVSLEDMMALRDESANQLNYQPRRLANHSIDQCSLDSLCDLEQLTKEICRVDLGENPEKLLKKLRTYVSQNHRFKSRLLKYNDRIHLCVVYDDISRNNEIEIVLLRSLKDFTISNTLTNYIVDDLVKTTISNNHDFLRIIDPYLNEMEKIALQDQYFVRDPNGYEWLKCCHKNTLSAEEAVKYLEEVAKDIREYSTATNLLISLLNSEKFQNDPLSAMDVERLLWPLKIENSNIPSFIVPIRPEAAKELFDVYLARENLFGVQKSSLFFSLESVYYKSPHSHGGLNQAPARILWYVSKYKNRGYSDLSTIRACSQVNDVIIDSPEELHKRFQHLGFYDLKQIQDCANAQGKVMAIKFSHTELFDVPIQLKTIQQCLESAAPMQSVRKISQDEFITFYRLGFNLGLT